MTLREIQALVVSVDPSAGHYESASKGRDGYTVWREVRRLGLSCDDGHAEGWAFQIDRFSKVEGDPVAAALFDALEADDRVAFEYLVDYETDTRWIHHIYDCEGY